MPGHPDYQLTPNNYDAVAVENQITREWETIWFKATPLMAMIHAGEKNFRKSGSAVISGNKITFPVQLQGVTAFNELTAGVEDADEIPTSWPTYDPTEGFTQAAYEFTHIQRPMPWTSSQETLLSGQNTRANLKEGKIRQLQGTFASIIANMMSGTNPDSRKSLMGVLYAAATTNTVGGIPQSTNSDWQADVSAPAGGVLTLAELDGAVDRINRNATIDGDAGGADIALLSYNGSAFNCFGKIREQILPSRRIIHDKLHVTYGITSMDYNGLACVMDNRLGGNTGNGVVVVLKSSDWGYAGYKQMVERTPQRILGSTVMEHMFEWWGALYCKQPRNIVRLNNLAS